MTGRLARTARLIRTLSSLVAADLIAGCTNYFEIPIETPIKPKLDVTPFQRILVAGFLAGGSDDVDGNLETTRLLRSQLRTKSDLRVIDTDVLPLMQEATAGEAKADRPEPKGGKSGDDKAAAIKDAKDLAPYEHIFGDVEYWKQIGEEYQNPLIVTGTVLFQSHSRSGFVSRDVEQYDSFGRRRVVPVRTFLERKGFILRPKFVFIDGRTGAQMHSESYREEVLYNAQQNTPALSSYFELMDRLVPNFLGALSSQKVRGTRVLLL